MIPCIPSLRIAIGLSVWCFFSTTANATTWLLVDFGASASQNAFGVEGWNRVFLSPSTEYIDSGPGGTLLNSSAGEDWTLNYQGVEGTPREFQAGERIVVTWYNQAEYDIWFTPRISFDDPDGFNRGEVTGHWYGMSDASGNRTRTEITVPSRGTAVSVYDINEEPAAGVPSSIGTHTMISVSVGTGDFYPFFVCDKIEIANETDRQPPSIPTQLHADSITDSRINLSWEESSDNLGVAEYRVYINRTLYRIFEANRVVLTGMESSTEYAIAVSAVDAIGNESGLSDSIRVVTPSFQGRKTLIDPKTDLHYLGAFRLPEGQYGINDFYYSGDAAAYYSAGDPGSADDGFPGSIYLTSFFADVAEITIPPPVLSPDKNYEALNAAEVLQGFQDISGGFPMTELHWWQGLAYLPAQGGQTSGKLYYCFAEHLYYEERNALSHCWFDLDLSHPNTQGFWRMGGNLPNYLTSQYLFEIPGDWAAVHTPKQFLATGRCRAGGQVGCGPAIYAIGPWNDGNPPPNHAELSYTTLLQYGDYTTEQKMENWADGDIWNGGAWITAGDKSAVMFAGDKYTGHSYYGYYNGTVYTDIEFDSNFEAMDRGWMATATKGQMIFYDPADLAAVASGRLAPYEPQPYAVLDLNEYLFHHATTRSNEMHRINSLCYDRERNLLYIFEHRGDELPAVHVWKIEPKATEIGDWCIY